jgi:hypothetical protein
VDTAYISALSALGGATIGGLTSFGSSWLTERTQLRFTYHEAIKSKREAPYVEFVDEAARLYGDALGHQKDDAGDLVKLFALLGRMRLVSPGQWSPLRSEHLTRSLRPTLQVNGAALPGGLAAAQHARDEQGTADISGSDPQDRELQMPGAQ